jgi:DNA polymerase-3 subunit gamma/tau
LYVVSRVFVSYQVLARKYRPRTFAEVVGQQHAVRALVHALDSDRVHHAFLFTGTRGVGKTTIARILAKSLNCEKGVSSQPCGSCSACVEVDEGRFVDLIEVDAASRTKVDDTRELLENVQYASMRGRYKVYLIDEVHMLSGHSFNALLKTLEEPPPHVKFLLATTDPQKLPMTVLSRCLQFNLKRLLPDLIGEQLRKILDAEGVTHDEGALRLLARAADGSMRDGLSLLDQAIAFGGGAVKERDVREMLGTIDQDAVQRLLQALTAGDARALLGVVADVSEHSSDYDAVLSELLLSLHQISLAQAEPALLDDRDGNTEMLLSHARSMTPEDVQLYYQIGLSGRRDLTLAPDPRSGLEMILLRMLVFRPAVSVQTDSDIAGGALVTAQPKTTPTATASASLSVDSWGNVVSQLKLSGLAGELASNSALESYDNGEIALVLDENFAQLHSKEREAALRGALEGFYGIPVRLTVRVGTPATETPAQQRLRLQDVQKQAAMKAIYEDPNVKALQERFNARVNPDSVRSKV